VWGLTVFLGGVNQFTDDLSNLPLRFLACAEVYCETSAELTVRHYRVRKGGANEHAANTRAKPTRSFLRSCVVKPPETGRAKCANIVIGRS
jgi:hypothetical protein